MNDTGWHRADIIAAVHKRNTTLRALSIAAGFAPSTMRSSLLKPHPRANRYLAKFLNIPPHTIWPNWYGADGRKRVGRENSRSRRPLPSSQKRKAA